MPLPLRLGFTAGLRTVGRDILSAPFLALTIVLVLIGGLNIRRRGGFNETLCDGRKPDIGERNQGRRELLRETNTGVAIRETGEDVGDHRTEERRVGEE